MKRSGSGDSPSRRARRAPSPEVAQLRRKVRALAAAAKALRANEERYRLLVEQAVDGIFVSDKTGRYLEVNEAGCQLLGYDRAEILSRTIADVLDADEVPRIAAEVERFADGAVVRSEWRFRRKDGSVFIGEVVGRQLPDGRLQAILRDITPRKLAEIALRQNREDLNRAQAIGKLGWWRLDLPRDLVIWSDETFRIFGLAPGARITPEQVRLLVDERDRAHLDERWRAALRGEPYDVEHRISVHGRERWVRQKAYVEFDGQGQAIGAFGIAQDVTTRRKAENRLRALVADQSGLLAASRLRVRQNLELVLALLVVQAERLPDARPGDALARVHRHVAAIARAQDTFDDAGADGRPPFSAIAGPLLRALWAAQGARAARVHLQFDLPAEGMRLPLRHAVPCALVLLELVENALLHAFPGEPDGALVHVAMDIDPDAGRIQLRVRDNGIGLPANFDWKTCPGLGLRMVALIAAQLGGTVWTSSGPETEFILTFMAGGHTDSV